MGRHVPARQRLARMPLSERLVLRALLTVWPRRNRYGTPNLSELLSEARDFGFHTFGAYLRVLKRHRRAVVRMDREPLDLLSQRVYVEDFGRPFVADRERRRYFFSLEGLTRCAFEAQFGDRHYEYCRRYRKDEEARHAT
jgi:hypothetical protein